jgi:hypothetical protein
MGGRSSVAGAAEAKAPPNDRNSMPNFRQNATEQRRFVVSGPSRAEIEHARNERRGERAASSLPAVIERSCGYRCGVS